MRRVLAILVAAAALTMGLTSGTASADVHNVSQADCGKSPNAGAIQSRRAIDVVGDHGRPDAQIPISASPVFYDNTFPGKGNLAGAQGQFCG
jgi:outer membrane lipoprotein SlyB